MGDQGSPIKSDLEDIKPEWEHDGGFEDDAEPDLDISKVKESVWLVKVPKAFLEKLTAIKSEEPITLGKMRIEDKNFDQLKFFLDEQGFFVEDMPVEYDIKMTNKEPKSTYIFSERPLGPESSKGSPVGKFTAIEGRVAHECALMPVMNERYRNLIASRRTKADIPVRQIQRLDAPQHQSNTSLNIANNRFSTFIQKRRTPLMPNSSTSGNQAPDKGVRLPKAELLDVLFERFGEYEYWTLKGLREVTRQPETWLKEVLSEIGVLLKKGPYALKWTLKTEYKDAVASSHVSNQVLGNDILE